MFAYEMSKLVFCSMNLMDTTGQVYLFLDDFFRWLPKCADKFLEMKTAWRSLVPDKNRDSLKLIESFFYCARILMSMQLRSLVMRSLHRMLSLFVRFKVSSYVFIMYTNLNGTQKM